MSSLATAKIGFCRPYTVEPTPTGTNQRRLEMHAQVVSHEHEFHIFTQNQWSTTQDEHRNYEKIRKTKVSYYTRTNTLVVINIAVLSK